MLDLDRVWAYSFIGFVEIEIHLDTWFAEDILTVVMHHFWSLHFSERNSFHKLCGSRTKLFLVDVLLCIYMSKEGVYC
jgi:hypothetical protein